MSIIDIFSMVLLLTVTSKPTLSQQKDVPIVPGSSPQTNFEDCDCQSNLLDGEHHNNVTDELEEALKTNKKIKVDLFVISLCSYGVDLELSLVDIYKEHKSQIDLEIHFIGSQPELKATSSGFPKTKRVCSSTEKRLFGQVEREEAIRQLVIRKKRGNKYWDYLSCRLRLDHKENWRSCLIELGIDEKWLTSEVQSEAGDLLLEQDTELAREFGIHDSPTLLIDGVEIGDP